MNEGRDQQLYSLGARSVKTVPGQFYGSPKEVWGFRTKGSRDAPETIARRMLAANRDLLGLAAGLRTLRRRKIIASLGARHVIYQQFHRDLRIHRAYVTVHMSRNGSVFLVKNRALPVDLLPRPARARVTRASAVRRAYRSVELSTRDAHVMDVEKIWFPVRDTIRLAYKVRLHRDSPREEWICYVDARNGALLSRYDNLSLVQGRGRVFDPNPVIALGDHELLLRDGKPVATVPDAAYATATLYDLDGTGYLEGRRVTTAPTHRRRRRADHIYEFGSTDRGFEEVMAYHHLDRAIRYLETLGYRENRAIFRAPLDVDVNGTTDDNSWYSPGLRQLTFGTGGVDDAEDGDTILHEFGHALQDAICPDFGQSMQAAAMGEGFSDYFAASFFAERKPPRYRTSVMTWDGITFDENDPPCVRRVDSALTFESFDHSVNSDEHDNGMIWSATLWDIRNVLGRHVADRIIIESHFQLDGFTTFARGARAILDADRNLYRGRHVSRARQIFRQRGIGPVE